MSQTLTGTRDAQMQMYRQEYIKGFERGGSQLRKLVTTEHMKEGNTTVFLVADTGNATAVTRGSDGEYPTRVNNNNQTTLTLNDYTDLPKMNGFDIFSSQGPQREIMFQGSQSVIARKTDDLILATLDTGTRGVSATASTDALDLWIKSIAILGAANAGVVQPGDVSAVVTPAFYANLAQTAQFGSKDWVTQQVMVNGFPSQMELERFLGVNLIVHSGLSGITTAAEKCFMFHKNGVGHALDKDTFAPEFGFNSEQNYSWVRTTTYQGSALLQNTGVVEMLHDATGYAAASI